MFTKDNIVSVRYTDPQNTTIEVLYTDHVDGKTRPFYFPSSPTTTVMWKILKEAKWTPSKIADSTVKWIKEQTAMQYEFAAQLSRNIADEKIIKETSRLEGEFANKSEVLEGEYNTKVDNIRERYDARVTDISSSINQDTNISSLYNLINDLNNNEEAVFRLKLDILEDESIFKDMTKANEKSKRREIRKCKTIKEIIKFLDN